MPVVELDGVLVGDDHPPYVVAEISGNHNGSFERATQLIDAAVRHGADAVKLQTYTPATMTIKSPKSDFQITGGLWDGYSLWDLYEWAHTPYDWHEGLFSHARSRGITCISTPFDETAVDLLENIGCPFYKIASFEMTDMPLIEKVAATGKPIILSTGMATFEEIAESVTVASEAGCSDLVILHCVSGYPTPVEETNLRCISELSAQFDSVIGLSDHTLSNATAIASVSLGASLIEKHFTLDRAAGGPDAAFSMEPEDLGSLTQQVREAWKALGEPDFSQKSSERENSKFRRSVYAIEDISRGEPFTPSNIRRIRPGNGVAPKYYVEVLGENALADIEAGTPIAFAHFRKG